jgi:long-chain fatty acid transport protein
VYQLEQDGKADAWGYNFGILLKPSESFRIGASFRSGFELDSRNEDTTLTGIHPAVAPLFGGGTTFHTKGDCTVKVPATFALGVAYMRGRLTVEADADWTFWSSYRNLLITFRDEVRNSATGGPVLVSTNSEKNWKDGCAFRIGAEHRTTDRLALRAGFAYDPSPAPAETLGPELPDADRLNYMLGVGYKIGAWTIDLAGMYIDKKDRRVSNLALDANGSPIGMDGEWSGDAWLAGLNMAYSF